MQALPACPAARAASCCMDGTKLLTAGCDISHYPYAGSPQLHLQRPDSTLDVQCFEHPIMGASPLEILTLSLTYCVTEPCQTICLSPKLNLAISCHHPQQSTHKEVATVMHSSRCLLLLQGKLQQLLRWLLVENSGAAGYLGKSVSAVQQLSSSS